MVETKIDMRNRLRLQYRVDNQQPLTTQVAAWESARQAQNVRLQWTFTRVLARQKRHTLYPSIED